MRRSLIALALLALAAPAVPAFAADEVHAACANPGNLPVLAAGASKSGTLATPSAFVGEESTSVTFLLDLAGKAVTKTGSVDADLTWLVPANDYDLSVASSDSSGVSENFQPVDAAEEFVGISGIAHCDTVTVTAIDFLAPVVADSLTYSVTAR